jgi:hypothetical protein
MNRSVSAPKRHYGPAYFREVEAHWGRMVNGAPDEIYQFGACVSEGTACIRIAGYSPDTFRAVFTQLARTNGLGKRLGGDDALRTYLDGAIESQVTNYEETVRKAREQFLLIINDELNKRQPPANLFNQLDALLEANDGDRLREFLNELSPPDARRAITYVDRRVS